MRLVLAISLSAAACAGGVRRDVVAPERAGGVQHAPAPSDGPIAHVRPLAVTVRRDHVDTLAREPMLVEHPGGALFISAYNHVRPGLWKSLDQGGTWARVDVGSAAQGAIGNSDADLAVAPDGTLYLVALSFDSASGHGRQIAVGVSPDTGATWRWSTISRTVGDDRPWVAVTPTGIAHVVWNDGHGVQHAASRDRGATWTHLQRVSDRGGSSHLAAGPHGELAVRIAPGAAAGNVCDEGADFVVVSVDGGATWQSHAPPGGDRPAGCSNVEQEPVPRWVDPLAWDGAGALYALWTTTAGVWLGRSTDRGSTWTTWQLPGEPADTAFFPYLTARGTGALAATWFTHTGDSLHWRAARLEVPAAGPPRVALSPPLTLESWRGEPPAPDTAGEYLPNLLLPDGSVAVVTPIQHEAAHRLGFTWWRLAEP